MDPNSHSPTDIEYHLIKVDDKDEASKLPENTIKISNPSELRTTLQNANNSNPMLYFLNSKNPTPNKPPPQIIDNVTSNSMNLTENINGVILDKITGNGDRVVKNLEILSPDGLEHSVSPLFAENGETQGTYKLEKINECEEFSANNPIIVNGANLIPKSNTAFTLHELNKHHQQQSNNLIIKVLRSLMKKIQLREGSATPKTRSPKPGTQNQAPKTRP